MGAGWRFGIGAVVAGLLFAGSAGSAGAAAPKPFGHSESTLLSGPNGRFYPTVGLTERVPSWDGTPLDVDVTLPPTGDGPWPTVVLLHGFGAQDKTTLESFGDSGPFSWTYDYTNYWYARHGYAVVNPTARGHAFSCGYVASRTPDCLRGWTHFADQRYEARDVQYLLGLLVDEGITKPDAIGVTGVSYGGVLSLELAFLRNRIRLPDGSFAPWRSPRGVPLAITAAWDRWGYSNVATQDVPNGRFRDDRPVPPDEGANPIGVAKLSGGGFVQLEANSPLVYVAPPGFDPTADDDTWAARFAAGEPYGADVRAIIEQIQSYHSPTLSGRPAPLLIENGWTDDLIPASEGIRAYNEVRAAYPSVPVSLQLGDLGHPRGRDFFASAPVNEDVYYDLAGSAFFDHYLKGARGGYPAPGSATTFTQTCPESAPAGGPYVASSYMGLRHGAIHYSSPAAQEITSGGGNPATGIAMDPFLNGGNSCDQVRDETAAGTAVYRIPVRHAFTLIGPPTITARLAVQGNYGQLDARLWDVGPDGQQTLVTRGPYRLLNDQQGEVTWQLVGNAYRFVPGHVVKLELLGNDSPFLRPSNGSFTIRVSSVTISLPTYESQTSPPGRCAAARTLRIHTRGRIVAARATIAGRRLPVRLIGSHTVEIRLGRRRRSRYTVVLHLRMANGRSRILRRHYGLRHCRRPHKTPSRHKRR